MTTTSVTFDSVDVRAVGNKWAHLTIVNNVETERIECFINGAFASSQTGAFPATSSYLGVVVGGDQHAEEENRFLGKICDVCLFNSIRSREQIASDVKNVKNTDNDLIAHYQLTGKQGEQTIKNSAGTAYDLSLEKSWFYENEKKQVINDYAASIAVLGDIQRLTCYTPQSLHYPFDWIVENKDRKNIQYVITTGDSVDLNTADEWTRSRAQFRRFESVGLPYMVNQGNHDGDSEFINAYNDGVYNKSYDGSYSSSDVRNTYRYLTIGKVKYILFTLQLDAPDAVYAWVDQVLESNLDCVAIMSLHVFIDIDYTFVDNETDYSRAHYLQKHSGLVSWNKCFKKHSNIALIICGHEHTDDTLVRKLTGDNGNIVTTMLVNPQGMDQRNAANGGYGMVCMLYFSEDGKTIQTEWFSSITRQYHKHLNQMTIKLFE